MISKFTRNVLGCALIGSGVLAGHAQARFDEPAQGGQSPRVQSTWSITQNDNGKSFTITSTNGKLAAKIDGKDVPADRVRRVGDSIQILDETGEVLFEQTAMDANNGVTIFGGNGRNLQWNARGGGRGLGGIPDPLATVNEPKVMAGVQLVEVDPILLGHFGLNEGDATLVSGVHEGLPAAAAGLKPYDIIVGIDGQSPASQTVVRERLRSKQPGETITLDVISKGQKKSLTLTMQKFDRAKLESAKMQQITSATTDIARAWSPRGGVDMPELQMFNDLPLRAMTIRPGQNNARELIIQPPNVQMDMAEMQRRIEETIKRMHEQFGQPNAGNGPNPLDARMKRMEDMLQEMMNRQRQGDKDQKKDEKTSRYFAPTRSDLTA